MVRRVVTLFKGTGIEIFHVVFDVSFTVSTGVPPSCFFSAFIASVSYLVVVEFSVTPQGVGLSQLNAFVKIGL